MKILVIGATGSTGRHLVTQSLSRGHGVVALVRQPHPDFNGVAGVTEVEGDVLAPEAVSRALVGCDAVLSALGSRVSLVDEVTLLSNGTQIVVDAMRSIGVKRLIAITGIGAGDSRGHGGFLYDTIVEPLVLRQVYKDKDRQEEVIRGSGLDWTIVRPAQLTDGAAESRFRVLTDLTGVSAGTIARADVATFMLTELETPRFIGRTPLITN